MNDYWRCKAYKADGTPCRFRSQPTCDGMCRIHWKKFYAVRRKLEMLDREDAIDLLRTAIVKQYEMYGHFGTAQENLRGATVVAFMTEEVLARHGVALGYVPLVASQRTPMSEEGLRFEIERALEALGSDSSGGQ